MESSRVRFQPLFLIYIFLCIYFSWFNQIFYYVVTIFLHEYGHLFVAKILGYKLDTIVFSLFGGGINSFNYFKRKDDILISIAGPCVNLILIILSVCLWWIFPITYLYLYEFVVCNFVVMIFNLIPIYPLDGGRIFFATLSKKIKKNKLLKMNKILCFFISCILLILFVISLFFAYNFNLLFMSIFFILNMFIMGNDNYIKHINILNKDYTKPIEIRYFKIDRYDKLSMIKVLNQNYYSIFEYDDGVDIKQITEDDLIKDKD